MPGGVLDPHMAAEAVTDVEHPTGHDHDVEPPRRLGWLRVVVFVVIVVILAACAWSMLAAA